MTAAQSQPRRFGFGSDPAVSSGLDSTSLGGSSGCSRVIRTSAVQTASPQIMTPKLTELLPVSGEIARPSRSPRARVRYAASLMPWAPLLIAAAGFVAAVAAPASSPLSDVERRIVADVDV